MAMIAHMATLKARVPFLHFFDGFRTSHEVNKIELLLEEDVRSLIDEDLVDGAPRPRAQPRPPGAARLGAEPRRVLPGARGVQRLLHGGAGHRAGIDGPLRQAHRSPLRTVRLRRQRQMPSGCWCRWARASARRARRWTSSSPRGEKVGLLTVRLYRPFDAQAFVACAAEDRARDRRARPHQGAGRDRRAAVPGRRHRAGRGVAAGQADAARDRRPLRAVVEGIHAGDGQGGARRTAGAATEAPFHRRHRRRRHAPVAEVGSLPSTPKPKASRARCSTAWAPTGRWVRPRTRSRSSARTRRSTPRATSSTTARSPARSPCRTCASGRSRSSRPI